MKKGRLIIGLIVLFFAIIYIFLGETLFFDLIDQITILYGSDFTTLIIPAILIIIGFVLILASLSGKESKRDFSNRVGKKCPSCGQVISELASKCPYCGKIQR